MTTAEERMESITDGQFAIEAERSMQRFVIWLAVAIAAWQGLSATWAVIPAALCISYWTRHQTFDQMRRVLRRARELSSPDGLTVGE